MAVYIRTYDMEMPSPCPRCGEVYELDDLLALPHSQELVCEDCLESEDTDDVDPHDTQDPGGE